MISKDIFLKIIIESDTIKKKLSNNKRNNLIENIKNLSDEKFLNLIRILEKKSTFKNKIKVIGKKISNITQKDIEKAIFIAGMPLPIPASEFLMVGAFRLAMEVAMKYNYKCGYQCNIKKVVDDRSLCYKKCKVLTINKAINEVKKGMGDCWYEDDPSKCRQEAIEYLHKLYDKLGNSQISLKMYQITLKERQKKNAKLQQN